MHEKLFNASFSFILGMALGAASAAWFWPWLGPQLLTPFPTITTLGVWAWALYCGLGAAGRALVK